MSTALEKIVHWVEMAVATLLVIMAVIGTVDVVIQLVRLFSAEGFLTPEGITRVLDTVLVVFIVVELFNIALAYLQRRNVIPIVLEAGLVAVVRKLVVFESGTAVLEKAAALSMLILAVGITWFLLRRAGVCPSEHANASSE
ncbi:MAG: phosphate-starvation-inducible PsiE family protein [Coriobacteriia bacterium]|nr:phosphate-starvation-inducible PsiE family protein [Coriobacteriia bacterium]